MTTQHKKELWQKFPEKELSHLHGKALEVMQIRRRQRLVRYWCFRLQTLEEQARPLQGPELMTGFIEFWLEQKPVYAIDTKGNKVEVPPEKAMTVEALGGYSQFAKKWDVDENLDVYIRHLSVWQEWNLTLMRVVPYIGDT